MKKGILTAVMFALYPLFLRWTAGFSGKKKLGRSGSREPAEREREEERERDTRAHGRESAQSKSDAASAALRRGDKARRSSCCF